jgi:dynein heavy chain
MRILDCYFFQYVESDFVKVSADDIEEFEPSIEPLFIFALTWSIGCTTNLDGRDKFSQKLRTMLSDKVNFPKEGMMYDYMWDKAKKEWIIWTNTVEAFNVDNKLGYTEIVVPTFDSIRMQYVTKLLLLQKKHVLCPGPTGTGKTVNI